MKVINVNVQIQMSIPNNDTLTDDVSHACRVLKLMNEIVSMSQLEADPQIFVESICDSDILEIEEEEQEEDWMDIENREADEEKAMKRSQD